MFKKVLFLSLLITPLIALAQSNVKGDMLSLRGVTVPAACYNGQMIHSSSDHRFKTCSSGTFQDISTPTFSGLIANAPTYASNTTTISSMASAGNAGQIFTSNGSSTAPSMQDIINDYNFVLNSGFDFFQESISKTVTATGGGTPTAAYIYGADQWYVKNILGGGTIEGIITASKQPSSLPGSGNALRVIVTTAPTGTGIQNGLEVYQPLSALASAPLFNQTASFSINVIADNHVNQIGLQFYYATSEVKLTTAIGSETLCSVNSGSYTLCSINGQALGSAWAPAGTGIVGIRIRPTAVSSGNLYDLNNGFDLEQAMWNLGSSPHTWHRQNLNPATELSSLQYFYEKSYSITTVPATTTLIGMLFTGMAGSGTFTTANTAFKVTHRNVPTMSYWDGAGNATKYSTFSGGAWSQVNNVGAVTEITPAQSGFMYRVSATSLAGGIHWVADSRM